MSLCRPTPVLAAAALLAGLLASPTIAAAVPDQELPFLCGEQWTGSTRSTHRPHPAAVDFNAPGDLGKMVIASAAGVVSRVEDAGSGSYGKWVTVAHPEGYSTLYAHLKAQWVVPGQFLDQGTPLGRVGDTGAVSGAHLHYEQRLGAEVRPAYFHGEPFRYGVTTASQNCPDVPLAGDWDGDRSDQVAVFRPEGGAGLFELHSGDASAPTSVVFGRAGDLPIVGDWDGDGVTDLGLRRQQARVFLLRGRDGSVARTRLGFAKDVPVTGDWDGDGATDLGLWRPAAARFRLVRADGTQQVVRLGGPASQPVTGDWDGDGVSDLGVFDAATATFSLRTVSPAGQVSVTAVELGSSSDLPVTGDWNGDRVTDVGIWTPATATYTLRVTPASTSARRPAPSEPELRTLVFGRPR